MTDPAAMFAALVRVETRLWNLVDARLRAEHDLSVGVLQFLQLMDRQAPCRVQDISRTLEITVGATSKAVDRIEARGWCERRANPGDRRSSLLALTPAGRGMLAAATPTFATVMAELLATLPPGAATDLAHGLELLDHQLDVAIDGRRAATGER
jgi:DNA-binding MarR family transcriptional regulator